jgi:hypothetical protein
MALIEMNFNPSKRNLKWFGALALAFFGILGGLVWSASGTAAVTLWVVGLAFCLIYYALGPMQLVLYRGWLRTFQPLGWLIAHTLFGFVYFIVFTLIGFGLRVFRYDPLHLRRTPGARTYWTRHVPQPGAARYFRQF